MSYHLSGYHGSGYHASGYYRPEIEQQKPDGGSRGFDPFEHFERTKQIRREDEEIMMLIMAFMEILE